MYLRANLGAARRNFGGNMPCGGSAAGPASPIRFAALPRLRRAQFIYAAIAALAAPGFAQAAAGLCPADGNRRGKVASVNERLELTLVDGIHLKIAGVDPPRPTPGNSELDILARDRLAQWLAGQEPFASLSQAWTAGGARRPMCSLPSRNRQGRLDSHPCRSERRSSTPVSPAMSHRPGGPRLQGTLACRRGRRAGRGPWPLVGSVLCGHHRRRLPVLRRESWHGRRITAIADRRPRIMLYFGPRQGWDFSVTMFPRNGKAFEETYANLAALSGHTVRVRGLLDTRFGPQIEISDPDEIEVIDHQIDADAAPPSSPAPR